MSKKIGKYIKSFDGAEIYYELNDFGKKDKCLVFIHGLGGNVSIWKKELDYFKDEGVATIAIDLRGHGRSAKSDIADFYKFENFVNDVINVMAAENFENYCLIGHSMGGMIATYIAAEQKPNAKILVLVDADYKIRGLYKKLRDNHLIMSFLELLAKNVPNIEASDQEDLTKFVGTGNVSIDRAASDILHVSLKSYLLIIENLLGYKAAEFLNKIAMPTLIIEGTKDSVIPPEVAEKLKHRIKHSELEMIEGANHFLIINNPLDVSREIERFLIKRKFI